MKRIYQYFTIVCLGLMTFACNDDFLERTPETSIGAEDFFNSEEDLSMYILNLYDFPGHGIYVGDAATDNAATTGNTELKTMMISSPSSATITNGWDWEDDWAQLRAVNFFLENYEKAALTEDLMNHYQGLARFFRAKFYVEKVKRYSDVPWYDYVISSDDEEALMKARDPREFVVDRLLEDFTFAAEHVQSSSETGAVNSWVVKAYLARFALYEGTFRKYHPELNLQSTADEFIRLAQDVSQDIINNGGYSLYSTGNPTTDYLNLFNSASLSDNPEIILARYFENDLLNSGWWEYMFGNYEVSPAKDLLQTYLMADGSFYTNQPDYATHSFVEEFVSRDPRLSQTYAYPGFELIFTGTYAQGGGTYVQQLAKNFTGYHQIKGLVNNTDQAVQNGLDIPIVRYAEILLTYAEAKAELGELTQGDLDMSINLLRTRVGMPPLMMSPPIDPVQEAHYANISSAQKAELLEIRRERRVELALEGYRQDDLMRWYAGDLLEKAQEGIYFSGLGAHDLTGDGIPDIMLIDAAESIPEDKEFNELGEPLIYYRAGTFGQDASVFLENGTSGTIQTTATPGTFEAPKYYYRPIPQSDVVLNPNLTQIFGWE
uniref:RagB/SusD family nutrient uptake outer membrane protein n=1 Tax=Roseihalotalea indica TaxID=2867963 RepID=A0AA49GKW8_9BACT|nr:RagB/SusD family nutrient uptake outer membrane protein [Tunicatimonas sp. TK19036]